MRYFRNRDDNLIFEGDATTLRHELDEAEQTIHSLTRQISREQAKSAEVARSYGKVVSDLVKVSRENAELERERDMWRQRVEQHAIRSEEQAGKLQLTPAEARAIRKAMALLHHPDRGGDADRMKEWNAVLDQLAG